MAPPEAPPPLPEDGVIVPNELFVMYALPGPVCMMAPPEVALFPVNVLDVTERLPVFRMALVLPTNVHPLTWSPPALEIPPPVELDVRPFAMVTPLRLRRASGGTLMTPWVFPPLSVTANPFPSMTVTSGLTGIVSGPCVSVRLQLTPNVASEPATASLITFSLQFVMTMACDRGA